MAIATSSWFTKLDPARYARIGISRGVPRGQSGFRRYAKLNPGSWFNSISDDEYRHRYYDEILNHLDPATVVRELTEMAEGRIAVLLCWETPTPGSPWCHRGHVSEWLHTALGLEVFEVGQERLGCGHQHPKLAPSSADQGSFILSSQPRT